MLPEWPPGTVTILATAGPQPHAIPVSAAVRAGATRVLIGLAAGRGSLARLRTNPQVALAVLCDGEAFTAEGHARVVEEALIDGVVAVEIDVERVQDHRQQTFELQAGVTWRWTDPDAASRDGEVRSALEELARGPEGSSRAGSPSRPPPR
jgi:hypothetical protein